MTDVYWNTDTDEILFAVRSSNTRGNRGCDVTKYDSWLYFLRESVEGYLEQREKIGSVYDKGGLATSFLRNIGEEQKTDFTKMLRFLCDFTGRTYHKKTAQAIMSIFQSEKSMDLNSNKKKRKLDETENDDLCPPQKKSRSHGF